MNNIEISEMLILLHEENMFLVSMLLPLFSQNEKVSKELQSTYSTLMSNYIRHIIRSNKRNQLNI